MVEEKEVEKKEEEKKAGEFDRVLEEFREFAKEFGTESDRAAVILGAAKLDSLLYLLLTKMLLPTPGREDELFEGEAPLSSFSSKIDLAYRLGLIDPQFARALHLIRRIRNSFAHEISGCSLSAGGQRDRVRELVAPFESFEEFSEVRKGYFKKDDPASDFRTVLSFVLIGLEAAIHDVQQITGQPKPLIPRAWGTKKKAVTAN